MAQLFRIQIMKSTFLRRSIKCMINFQSTMLTNVNWLSSKASVTTSNNISTPNQRILTTRILKMNVCLTQSSLTKDFLSDLIVLYGNYLLIHILILFKYNNYWILSYIIDDFIKASFLLHRRYEDLTPLNLNTLKFRFCFRYQLEQMKVIALLKEAALYTPD